MCVVLSTDIKYPTDKDHNMRRALTKTPQTIGRMNRITSEEREHILRLRRKGLLIGEISWEVNVTTNTVQAVIDDYDKTKAR